MGNMRTMAFQVPDELFQKIKETLRILARHFGLVK